MAAPQPIKTPRITLLPSGPKAFLGFITTLIHLFIQSLHVSHGSSQWSLWQSIAHAPAIADTQATLTGPRGNFIFMPLQKNLWASAGSGNAPRL